MLDFFQLLGDFFSSEGRSKGVFVALVVLAVPVIVLLVVVLLVVLLIRPQIKWRTEWRPQQEALKKAGEIVVAELMKREVFGRVFGDVCRSHRVCYHGCLQKS